jgi:hypothetical protein
MKIGPGDSHTQFERHIEPREAGRSNTHFDSGEIVDGKSAALDEFEDSIQPALPAWDFGGKMRNQVQLEKPNDIGDVKAGEFFVVRNIQKDAVWIRQRRHACASFLVRRLNSPRLAL